VGARFWNFAIWAVLGLQLSIAVLYLLDLTSSFTGIRARPDSWALYELQEVGVFLALVAGTAMAAALALRGQKRAFQSEARLKVAQAQFQEIVLQQFSDWGLSRSEHDVAMLVIKGLSNGEIASVLGKSEGTVKAQCNAVFRKANVNGRPQLISGLIEDLLGEPMISGPDVALSADHRTNT